MNYTKKGFLVGLIYASYSLIIQLLIFSNISGKILNENVVFTILGIIQWPLAVSVTIVGYPLYFLGVQNNIILFLGAILVVLAGTLIGLLIGKIKSRNITK